MVWVTSFYVPCTTNYCIHLLHLVMTVDRNGAPGGIQDTAVSVHPGLIDTELARGWIMQGDVLGRFLLPVVNAVMRPLMPWILLPVDYAVNTVMFAATAPPKEVGVL
jgi:hypothetical protein